MAQFIERGEFGCGLGAERLRERAAGMKAAARRRIDRIGRIARYRRRLRPVIGIGRRSPPIALAYRDAPGVPHPVHRTKLDHFAEIHHQYAVGNVAHDVEVMADEEIGQSELALQVSQKIEHLGLDRLVQRRDRFVEDHEARRERQRARDIDALTAARRKSRADSGWQRFPAASPPCRAISRASARAAASAMREPWGRRRSTPRSSGAD